MLVGQTALTDCTTLRWQQSCFVHGLIAAEADKLCSCDSPGHQGMVSISVFAFKMLNQFQSPVLQVALLRQKLASEQQRARTAEASLAAQQQMQELLQTAVQAVLHNRGQPQVNHPRPFNVLYLAKSSFLSAMSPEPRSSWDTQGLKSSSTGRSSSVGRAQGS